MLTKSVDEAWGPTGSGEIVDRIFLMEDGAVPSLYDILDGNPNASAYGLLEAPAGVKIGMSVVARSIRSAASAGAPGAIVPDEQRVRSIRRPKNDRSENGQHCNRD